MTLREALELHIDTMRKRELSERSIETIRRNVEFHMKAWLDRPLATITRAECLKLHNRVTKRGKHAANHVIVHLSTIWNTAHRVFEDLPATSPTVAVTKNKVKLRRQEPIPWVDLQDWWTKVQTIKNQARRDLQLFILFTGLRRDDAKTVRWEHFDFDAGTMHRPRPKGGVDRAFTVPVSRFVIDLLLRRRIENGPDGGWVFPTTVQRNGQLAVTHIREAKEQRYDENGKKVSYLPTPHRLRDTFATALLEAGVDPFTQKILMNHALPTGDVTWGYQRPSLDFLRVGVEQVAAFLLEKGSRDEYGADTSSARSSAG